MTRAIGESPVLAQVSQRGGGEIGSTDRVGYVGLWFFAGCCSFPPWRVEMYVIWRDFGA